MELLPGSFITVLTWLPFSLEYFTWSFTSVSSLLGCNCKADKQWHHRFSWKGWPLLCKKGYLRQFKASGSGRKVIPPSKSFKTP